jgi:hypothetical protein
LLAATHLRIRESCFFGLFLLPFIRWNFDKLGIKKNNRQMSFISGGLELRKPTQDEGYSLGRIHFSIVVQI